MKRLTFIFSLLCLIFFGSRIALAKEITTNFINSENAQIGTAKLQELPNGILLKIDVSLPDGTHALHIHQIADCTAPDFKTAGGHFNPEGKEHGYKNPNGYHAGDLPNITVENGHITHEVFLPKLQLNEGGLLGRAIMVHDHIDDYMSNPAGDAGHRIACAVIK